MKNIKQLAGMIIMIGIFIAGPALAAPSWEPISGNEHNMVAYGKIALGMDFGSGGYVLYSFGPVGDRDCRSKSNVGSDGSYYATIVGSAAGDEIHFKLVDVTGNVYELQKILRFEPDLSKENFDLF